MKLKDYIKKLQKLAEKYPNATVCYSSDSEGNSFESVVYNPGAGCFDKQDRRFDHEDTFEEDDGLKVNAVCIN
jgi:hypothetical protein